METITQMRKTFILNLELKREVMELTVLLRINVGGVHLIFDIFGGRLIKGGVYTREAIITKYRESYNSIYQHR